MENQTTANNLQSSARQHLLVQDEYNLATVISQQADSHIPLMAEQINHNVISDNNLMEFTPTRSRQQPMSRNHQGNAKVA